MATRRTTFGKLERERQKREKAAAKRERRAALQSDEDDDGGAPAPQAKDEGAVLDALAELHRRFDDHEMDLEEFEAQRDELRAQLSV